MRIHQWLVAWAFVAGLVSLLAGPAMAANTNASLKGTYRHSTHSTCAEVEVPVVTPGFTPSPFFLATGLGERFIGNFTGVTTYDGIGTATETGEGILIFPGPYAVGSPTIITTTESCTYDYTVNPDGSFSRTAGVCMGSHTNGPAGSTPTYTLSNISIKGQIGATGSVLITNQVEPVEQSLVVNTGYAAKRICGFEGTAVRVK